MKNSPKSPKSNRISIQEAAMLLTKVQSPKHISFAKDLDPLKIRPSQLTITFDGHHQSQSRKEHQSPQNPNPNSQVNPFQSFSTLLSKRQSKQNIVKEERLQTLHKKPDKQKIVFQNYITSQKSSNQLHSNSHSKGIQMENGKDNGYLSGRDAGSKKNYPAPTSSPTTSSQIIKKFTSQSNFVIPEDVSKRMKLKDYLFLKQTIDNQKRMLKSKSQARFQNIETLQNHRLVQSPSCVTLKKSKVQPNNESIYEAVHSQANLAFNTAKSQIQSLLKLLTFENVTDDREQISSEDIAFISQIRKIVKQKIEESVKEMVKVMSNHSDKLRDAISQQNSQNLQYSDTTSLKDQNKMAESNVEQECLTSYHPLK